MNTVAEKVASYLLDIKAIKLATYSSVYLGFRMEIPDLL